MGEGEEMELLRSFHIPLKVSQFKPEIDSGK
jgi:hypothetical protein